MTPVFFNCSFFFFFLRGFKHQVRVSKWQLGLLYGVAKTCPRSRLLNRCACSGRLNPEDARLREHGKEGGLPTYMFRKHGGGLK